MRISLIGTYHAERGAVTVLALLTILERIQPEVVFAEIPRANIDTWRKGSYGTLESIAVARYADTHSIDVVPVDPPKPEDSFFQGWKEVSRAIERTSPAFRRLMDLNTSRNIRAYCASAKQTCGVFLVGAAHRKSLIEKLRAADVRTVSHVDWDLGGSQIYSG